MSRGEEAVDDIKKNSGNDSIEIDKLILFSHLHKHTCGGNEREIRQILVNNAAVLAKMALDNHGCQLLQTFLFDCQVVEPFKEFSGSEDCQCQLSFS